MSDQPRKVVIVPCSGIGKTYGTVSRAAAYDLVEELRPETTGLVGLPLLVLGDKQARATVAACLAVTIDGCKLACATKMVAQSGGTVGHSVAVLDVYRRHRDLKPQGIAELNAGGRQLAHALAEELADVVDTLSAESSPDAAAPQGGPDA